MNNVYICFKLIAMKQIEKIYGNDFGMAFFWKNENTIQNDKVQLVFKEMGFCFTRSEMQTFIDCIEESSLKNACCEECSLKKSCVKFLLKTPCSQIDLTVSMSELKLIQDLVGGTLFRIDLQGYLTGLGRN